MRAHGSSKRTWPQRRHRGRRDCRSNSQHATAHEGGCCLIIDQCCILPLMSFIRDFQRLSSSQRHTFVASFLGWTLDSLDFFLLIFCVKAISADFHAKPSDVLSAVFLTQAFRPVGALVFGMLADRY